ncbi:hypothetical protein DRO97_06420 [Archaeoglobales archaeon]|nr:MAG: hypothetical protein DRO97_06420 [Archaeoglobales archaeon]
MADTIIEGLVEDGKKIEYEVLLILAKVVLESQKSDTGFTLINMIDAVSEEFEKKGYNKKEFEDGIIAGIVIHAVSHMLDFILGKKDRVNRCVSLTYEKFGEVLEKIEG